MEESSIWVSIWGAVPCEQIDSKWMFKVKLCSEIQTFVRKGFCAWYQGFFSHLVSGLLAM